MKAVSRHPGELPNPWETTLSPNMLPRLHPASFPDSPLPTTRQPLRPPPHQSTSPLPPSGSQVTLYPITLFKAPHPSIVLSPDAKSPRSAPPSSGYSTSSAELRSFPIFPLASAVRPSGAEGGYVGRAPPLAKGPVGAGPRLTPPRSDGAAPAGALALGGAASAGLGSGCSSCGGGRLG